MFSWIIEIHGLVQGVGFRPFLHRLAQRLGLSGRVRNTAAGAELLLEADEQALRQFLSAMRVEAPAPAVIEAVSIRKSSRPVSGGGFHIAASRAKGSRAETLISPDLGVCPDCLRELNDPNDRRYHYPFINCTNCGPRFTVVRDVPYDRARTSMACFPMCPACGKEYEDLSSRRYHAQPNCCPVCGPRLTLYDADGRETPGDALETARRWLAEGKILAVKGLGGIHLACRADDMQLVETLRRRKGRDARPLAVMCRGMQAVRARCAVSPAEEAALTSPRRPIVLLKRHDGTPDGLSFTRELGVMLPYTPLHTLLFPDGVDTLVMTSANRTHLPILSQNEAALQALAGIADGFLLNDREIVSRCDDSLVRVQDGEPRFLRRSRGWTPAPVPLKNCALPVLACGAEQKASFCYTRAGAAFLSGHIGDLKTAETFDFYQEQLTHFKTLFGLRPIAVACDLHPDYLSTYTAERLCSRYDIPILRIQHHHAHLAACMADNALDGDVTGLIWDGTGLGDDGETLWGGELLCGSYDRAERTGTLRPIPLISGEAAIRGIWRIGLALLQEAGVPDANRFFRMEDTVTAQLLLRTDGGAAMSHGMGRLFDGMCAILGLLHNVTFEGQGAMLLEAAAAGVDPDAAGSFPLPLEPDENGLLIADWREMVRLTAEARRAGTPAPLLAARFQNTLVELGAAMCRAAREKNGLERVVLSGGVFQNRFLSARLPARLRAEGFRVFSHRRVAANDEGLCLGQAMAAIHSGVI